jgi:hypothetical protein
MVPQVSVRSLDANLGTRFADGCNAELRKPIPSVFSVASGVSFFSKQKAIDPLGPMALVNSSNEIYAASDIRLRSIPSRAVHNVFAAASAASKARSALSRSAFTRFASCSRHTLE